MKTTFTAYFSFLILLSLLVFSPTITAQDYRQTVKGTIVDKESHQPISFATVLISNGSFQQGTIANEYGKFMLENIPVGRKTIQVSFVGYKTITIPNLEVTSGKETVVNIEMVENVVKIDEVVVKAFHEKEKPLNTFAPISARTFSVEESQRYAGSGNDVSRMAMNFAGVAQATETTNEIIIRGNSPAGVLFRLEGVDIPNPSHYGDGGTTGGPISMLNNNVLSNSDFLTGAFPAEYGNTISGVFDLRMRSGNTDNHEFMIQTGLGGLEAGAEGPISRKTNASYLVNYRYSTMGLMSALGMSMMGATITDYQDVTFKLNFPSRKFGTISFFGLGGNSYLKMFDSERDTTQERQQMAYESDYEMDIFMKNYSGAVGLSHSYILGKSAYTRFILSATTIWNFTEMDSLSTTDRHPVLDYYGDFNRTKYAAKFYLNQKINSQHALRIGISSELQNFTMLDSTLMPETGNYRILRNYNGDDVLSQAYAQYKYKFTDDLQLTLGVNSILQASGNNFNLEPRAGLKWDIRPDHTLSMGYGMHSLASPVEIMNQEVMLENGEITTPNTDLGLTKSQHFVIGYDTKIRNTIRVKSEVYYQYISDALVEVKPSSYSFINKGAYTVTDVGALQNAGKAYNYGLEITVEKFMDKGSYFLSTLSIFESKYRGSDGILRDGAFNTNYVFNLLGGKEFTVGKMKKDARKIKKLVVDGKLNWAGGQRYTPLDLEASRTYNTTIFDESFAFSEQLQDYFRIDVRVAYKWVGKKSTQELAIDIRNVTNRENPFYVKFDPETGDMTSKGFGMMPDILYRISF